jgi:hypothetical protein
MRRDPMRILVYGGRRFRERDILYRRLDNFLKEARVQGDHLVIIQGDAGLLGFDGKVIQGADLFAKEWAIDHQVDHLDFPADWKNLGAEPCVVGYGAYGKYNKMAGFNRNQKMLDDGKPELAVECKGEKGTADMRRRLLKAGVPIIYLH